MKKIEFISRYLSSKKFKLLHLILALFLGSCLSGPFDNLDKFLHKAFPAFRNGTVIIVPGTGCATCLSEFERKIDSIVKLDTIRLVFTNMISKKLLRNRIAEKGLLNSTKIYIDSTNSYIELSKNISEYWPYPTYIKIKDGKVIKINK